MSEKRSAFPETTKKDWLAAARKELSGENPDKLSFQAGSQTLLPYYDASDLTTSSEGQRIGAGRMWVNAPRIAVTDAIAANHLALEHLQEGADGLLLEIQDSDVNVASLFSGIELPFCSVYFYGNATPEFLERFARYTAEKFDPALIRGTAYGLKAPQVVALQTSFRELKQFCLIGMFHEKPCTDASALSHLLKDLQDRFELMSQGAPRLPHSALLLTLSDDFLGEMIRIHALSMLWNCFREAYGDDKAQLQIHTWSRSLTDRGFEPQGNMISSVSRAVSGVIAGANVLTVDPESQEPLQSRTARNISFILQEESQLARASHMLTGAYFIEAASRKLAEETWSNFQTMVRK